MDSDTESQKLRNAEDVNGSSPPTRTIQLKRKIDWKTHVAQRIYILTWIPNYDKSLAISDMIAGITLGLTMIPQAIAYAALAGLPSQYGLYSAFVGNYALNFIIIYFIERNLTYALYHIKLLENYYQIFTLKALLKAPV